MPVYFILKDKLLLTCTSLGKQVVDFISQVIEGGETFDFPKWQSDGKM